MIGAAPASPPPNAPLYSGLPDNVPRATALICLSCCRVARRNLAERNMYDTRGWRAVTDGHEPTGYCSVCSEKQNEMAPVTISTVGMGALMQFAQDKPEEFMGIVAKITKQLGATYGMVPEGRVRKAWDGAVAWACDIINRRADSAMDPTACGALRAAARFVESHAAEDWKRWQ